MCIHYNVLIMSFPIDNARIFVARLEGIICTRMFFSVHDARIDLLSHIYSSFFLFLQEDEDEAMESDK